MHTQRIHEVLAEAIVGRHLLTHPFYRRWEAGTLSGEELAAYAEQYRHIERELPVTLAAIAAALPEGQARTLVEANLADELGRPEPHTQLFESFARASGAEPEARATPSTAALLAVVRTTASNDPVAALAMIAAYEVQAADIAGSKGDGLRRHYGVRRGGHPLLGRAPHPGGGARRVVGGGPGGARGRPRRGASGGDRLGRLLVALPERARGAGAGRRALLSAQLSVPWRPAAAAKAAARSR